MRDNDAIEVKLEELRVAHRNGGLASHEIVKSMGPVDGAVTSSWGPAMRR